MSIGLNSKAMEYIYIASISVCPCWAAVPAAPPTTLSQRGVLTPKTEQDACIQPSGLQGTTIMNLLLYKPSQTPHTPSPTNKPLLFEMSPSAPLPSPGYSSSDHSLSPPITTIVSKCNIFPDCPSTLAPLRLSVSDLPMLSCHYIQKGLFLPPPPLPIHPLLSLLTGSLSRALSFFPALAGRLTTLSDASIVISCNDAGAHFTHATSTLTLSSFLPSSLSDVPHCVKSLFPLDGTVSYHGHTLPLAAFQLTELADGPVFLAATVNHAVVDGTSFWNFFNAWAELCGGAASLTNPPDSSRNYFGNSAAVLCFPDGNGPEVTFPVGASLRERVFHFSREAITELKTRANRNYRDCSKLNNSNYEILGKQLHDPMATMGEEAVISSFQSLCAQLWKSVTKARKELSGEAVTMFRMAVNCRHRVLPPVSKYYFGNAIQSAPTTAAVGEVRSRELGWVAGLLQRSVAAHDGKKVRRVVEEWEAAPRCFPLGNPDGAGITMGSSPRFPMYEGNDFGWGGPLAVRSGKANKFDGKMSAFPARESGGVDLEICLAPETMRALLDDAEFMHYVSAGPVVTEAT